VLGVLLFSLLFELDQERSEVVNLLGCYSSYALKATHRASDVLL
jgi:hypothetical protein